MNNTVDPSRSAFFPRSKQVKPKGLDQIKENFDLKRKVMEDRPDKAPSNKDSKVNITAAVKDFSKIKKVVDQSPSPDNTNKIASLRQQIQAGTYKIDYDKVADRMLQQEF